MDECYFNRSNSIGGLIMESINTLKLALYDVEKEINFLKGKEEFYNALVIELIKLNNDSVDNVLIKFNIKSDVEALEFPRV